MAQDDVAYGYALMDYDSGRMVGIDSLSRETSCSHKFYCPCCHGEMYPTFGIKQVPHFRHNGEKCEPNKYLHSLAEAFFEKEFLECLNSGKQFIIELHTPVKCGRNCVSARNMECIQYEEVRCIDLTKIFNRLDIEKRISLQDHNRQPDIILSSENRPEHNLWIEIWVTHETNPEKRKDGKILEIKISSEKDLDSIKEHRIVVSIKGQKARLFNVEFPDESIVSQSLFDVNACPSNRPLFTQRKYYARKKPIIHFPKQIDSEFHFDPNSFEWVDLGLSSGVMWAKEDISGTMPFHIALSRFKDYLPSKEDACELRTCNRVLDLTGHNLILTGPNGNTIAFSCNEKYVSYWLNNYETGDMRFGQCFNLGQDRTFYINDKESIKNLSVRLVKRPI